MRLGYFFHVVWSSSVLQLNSYISQFKSRQIYFQQWEFINHYNQFVINTCAPSCGDVKMFPRAEKIGGLIA